MFHTCSLRVGYAKLTLLKDTSPFTVSSGSFSPPLRGILGLALMNYKENDKIYKYVYINPMDQINMQLSYKMLKSNYCSKKSLRN